MPIYECDICAEQFDENVRLPKLLPCQHTACLDCLLQMNVHGSITCLLDGREFAVENPADLPDNLYVKSRIRRGSSDCESPTKRLRACSQGMAAPGNAGKDEEDHSAGDDERIDVKDDAKDDTKGDGTEDTKGDSKDDGDDDLKDDADDDLKGDGDDDLKDDGDDDLKDDSDDNLKDDGDDDLKDDSDDDLKVGGDDDLKDDSDDDLKDDGDDDLKDDGDDDLKVGGDDNLKDDSDDDLKDDSDGDLKVGGDDDLKDDADGDADSDSKHDSDHHSKDSKRDSKEDTDDGSIDDCDNDSKDDVLRDPENGEVAVSMQQKLLKHLSHRRAKLMSALVVVQDGVATALQDRVQAEGELLQRTVACMESLEAQPRDRELRKEAARLLRAGAAVDRDLELVEARSASLCVEGCWQSGRVQLAEQPVLQLAALLLRKQASQARQDRQDSEASRDSSAGPQGAEPLKVLPWSPRVNVVNVTMRPVDEFKQEKTELLSSGIPIHVLTRVCCHPLFDPEFSLSLLWKHAAHLEEVHLYDASYSHLLAVHGMRALRKLQVRGVIPDVGSPNDALSSLPQLPPLPPRLEGQETGLTWLQLVAVPRETAQALILANRLSLRKLRLAVGPPTLSSQHQTLPVASLAPITPVWPLNCDDLENFLRCCRLQVLESLTLVRSEPCPSPSRCEMQLIEARRAAPANCRARCSFCRIWVTGNY